ncbi:hypothetical protein [Streptomyces sp. 142MFCol3.1]|nr:hypothetical protein [Streptomyces sp. 142MFCol3.1]
MLEKLVEGIGTPSELVGQDSALESRWLRSRETVEEALQALRGRRS